MKKTMIMLAVLLTLCGQTARARGIHKPPKAVVERAVRKAELNTRNRILEELAQIQLPARLQPAVNYLQAKNTLIAHALKAETTEQEQEAITAYEQGDFIGAYAKLGFDAKEVLYATEELLHYVPNLRLDAFRWPGTPKTDSDKRRLSILHQTLNRQKFIQNLAQNYPQNDEQRCAVRYFQTMDALLNRYQIQRLTKQDVKALTAYQDGELHAAYQILGFEWQEVINAVESLKLHQFLTRKNGRIIDDTRDLFAWPTSIEWNIHKRKK